MRALARIRGSARHRLPRPTHRRLEECEVGGVVDQEDHLLERDPAKQLLDLVDTTVVRRPEATQVHEDGVGVASEPRYCHPPGILVAEKIMDPVQSVRVRGSGVLGKPALQVFRSLDEGPRQASVQELEELMRLDCAVGGVGAGNQADRSELAPTLPEVREQPLGPPVEAKYAQQ